MDEVVTPARAEPQEISTAISVEMGISLQQTVYNAAELGWAIAELLGRSFLLQDEQPVERHWTGGKLVAPQEIYTPREKIRALVERIRFLADSLGVSSSVIDHENDPDNNRRYIDVLSEAVKLLSQHNLDMAAAVTCEQLRGKINERLFFWDLKIHDKLQDRPTAVFKAYMIGRSLSALRWYIGLQDKMLNDGFMEKICNEYIPMLQPYVSPFTPGALQFSIEPWWKAISSGQVQPGPDGEAPPELHRQTDIWYSLLIGERNALSYAPPSLENRRYIWKVLQVYWPVFLAGGLGLILILALLLFVIISQFNLIAKEVTAVAGLLTLLGVFHSVVNTISNIMQRAVSEATGTFRGSVIDTIRNSTLQEAINKAIFIPPAGAHQEVVQNTQSKR